MVIQFSNDRAGSLLLLFWVQLILTAARFDGAYSGNALGLNALMGDFTASFGVATKSIG